MFFFHVPSMMLRIVSNSLFVSFRLCFILFKYLLGMLSLRYFFQLLLFAILDFQFVIVKFFLQAFAFLKVQFSQLDFFFFFLSYLSLHVLDQFTCARICGFFLFLLL
uniref:Uncharacterized protein n=1 Tax=Octopus bimaculoides TaxID=37653 RepID=A0A0L8G2H8_OCTBM